jgi:hypothetical protein
MRYRTRKNLLGIGVLPAVAAVWYSAAAAAEPLPNESDRAEVPETPTGAPLAIASRNAEVAPAPPDTPGAAIGVGGQLALSGFGGLQLVYQSERYHIDGLISFFDAADTTVSIGGRFFWHAHRSERADFSLGAGLGLTHINDADLTVLHVEAVGQVRFFVAPAVAISMTMGVALQTLDGDVVGLGNDLLGGAGFSYFFQ